MLLLLSLLLPSQNLERDILDHASHLTDVESRARSLLEVSKNTEVIESLPRIREEFSQLQTKVIDPT